MDEKRMDQYRENVTDGAFVAHLDQMDNLLSKLKSLNVRWNKDGNMSAFLESLDGNLNALRSRVTLMIQKQLMAEGIVSEKDWKDMTLKFCIAAPKYMNVILDIEDRLGLDHCMYLDDTIRALLKSEDKNINKIHVHISDDDTVDIKVVDDPEPAEDD